MLLSNPAKFFLCGIFVLLSLSACGGSPGTSPAGIAPAEAPHRTTPFPTREPEVYTAELTETAGTSVRRIFIARSGQKLRIDYDAGTGRERSILRSDKHYLLSAPHRIYAEQPAGSSSPQMPEIMNTRMFTKFEELGEEGGLAKYRALVDDSTASEVIIFVDSKLGMPVKQEFYSIDGDTRSLQFASELHNIRLDADASLFEVPQDFRRASPEEFRRLTAK